MIRDRQRSRDTDRSVGKVSMTSSGFIQRLVWFFVGLAVGVAGILFFSLPEDQLETLARQKDQLAFPAWPAESQVPQAGEGLSPLQKDRLAYEIARSENRMIWVQATIAGITLLLLIFGLLVQFRELKAFNQRLRNQNLSLAEQTQTMTDTFKLTAAREGYSYLVQSLLRGGVMLEDLPMTFNEQRHITLEEAIKRSPRWRDLSRREQEDFIQSLNAAAEAWRKIDAERLNK